MDLSYRAHRLTLAPWDGASDLTFVQAIASEACGARWRVVELLAVDGQPFEAKVAWTAAHGSGLWAHITVARGTRLAVYARSVRVHLANLGTADSTVVVNIADSDSFVQTRNQHELRGEFTDDRADVTTELSIPPFADRLTVYLTDPDDRENWFVVTSDGQDAVRSVTPLSQLPADGLQVGGAGRIELTTASAGSWRAVYHLSL